MKSIKTLFVLLIALTVATTASAYNFTKDLELGSRGSDVTKLQEMLVGSGHLESDSVTGYFGPATELAVAKWQIANDIKPISGIFGAISRSIVASVPVANLSSASYMDEDPAPLTYMQARNAVGRLVEAGLLVQRQYSRALEVLFAEPSIVMTDSNGNQGITVKVGETFTISGTPKNLQGLSYEPGPGPFPEGKYYSRAYFFDPIFNDVCHNNEASTTGLWTMTCTPKTAGTGKIHVRIYKDGRTYTSNIVEVTVVPNILGNINLKITSPISGNYNYLSYSRLLSRDLSQERSTQPFMWKGLKLIVTDTMSLAVEGIELNDALLNSGRVDFYLMNESNSKQGKIFPIFMTGFKSGQGRIVKALVSDGDYNCSGLSDCKFSTVPAGKYRVMMSDWNSQNTYYSEYFNLNAAESLSNTLTIGEVKYIAKLADDLDIDGCSVPITVGSQYSVCDLYQDGKAVSRSYGTSGSHMLNVGSAYKMICNFTEGTPTRVEKDVPMCVRPATTTPQTPVVVTPTPKKLTSAEICAVVQKPTASVCAKSYPINKGVERMTGYVYNGFKYDISYKKNVNSSGAVCRDTCTAKAY